MTTVVSVNQFNSQATQPTEPVPLLEAESEIIYIRENAGQIRAQERYNITLNGLGIPLKQQILMYLLMVLLTNPQQILHQP